MSDAFAGGHGAMQDLQESHPTEGAGTESVCHGGDAEAQQRAVLHEHGQGTPGPGRGLRRRRLPVVGRRPRQLPVPLLVLVGAIGRQLQPTHGSQAGSGRHGHRGVDVSDAGGEHGHRAAPGGEARRPAQPAATNQPWSPGLDAGPVPAAQPMAGPVFLVSLGASALLKGQYWKQVKEVSQPSTYSRRQNGFPVQLAKGELQA